MLSSNSATLKQTLHADLKLVPRAKTSWASDILRALAVYDLSKSMRPARLFAASFYT